MDAELDLVLENLYAIMRNKPKRRVWLRFKKKLIAKDYRSCWRWAGKHQREARKYQYGMFRIKLWSDREPDTYWVHRCWGIWIYGGVIEDLKLVMDHRVCSHPPCVNPFHLNPCTQYENLTRPGVRRVTGPRKMCRREEHLMEGDNLIVTARGTRMCRACKEYAAECRKMLAQEESDAIFAELFKKHEKEVSRKASRHN